MPQESCYITLLLKKQCDYTSGLVIDYSPTLGWGGLQGGRQVRPPHTHLIMTSLLLCLRALNVDLFCVCHRLPETPKTTKVNRVRTGIQAGLPSGRRGNRTDAGAADRGNDQNKDRPSARRAKRTIDDEVRLDWQAGQSRGPVQVKSTRQGLSWAQSRRAVTTGD